MTTEPTFSVVPDGDETTGEDVVHLARVYGIGLDEWQSDVVRGILREADDGGWACSQAGLVVSRQSGKGQILAAIELAGLLLFREMILHTAHTVKTSSDAFRRLWGIFDAHPDLRALVHRHSFMTGAEMIELTSGAKILFVTRSASTGRGLSLDRLVIDEAQDLPEAEVAALQPTTFARPRAQSLYFGTAPAPGGHADALEGLRAAAMAGSNPRLAWWEWSLPWDADIDDREGWLRANPAVASGRVDVQAIENDRALLPADVFRTERLSSWPPAAALEAGVFDEDRWLELVDSSSVPVRDLVLGVDAGPSRSSATVCLAGRREDGRLHIEWYRTEEGVTWLPEWVGGVLSKHGDKIRAVVVDDRGAVSDLPWKASKVRVTEAVADDVAHAAGRLVDAVADGGLRHRGQVELTRGVLAARQRSIGAGGRFAWDRKAQGSSVLIAASLALWGVDGKVKRPVQSGQRRRVIVLP